MSQSQSSSQSSSQPGPRPSSSPAESSPSTIATFTLPSGLLLAVEPIATARSVSMTWLLPAGSAAFDGPEDGLAALLAELLLRGAGGLDSRAHSEALDRLGVQRSTHVGTHHLQIGATMLGTRLPEALPLLASMVLDPALPAEALDAVRSLCLQSLDSLDDDPQELVMLRLKERHLAPPFNRHGYGRREVLESATIEALRAAWARLVRPGGSILAFAGAVDARAVHEDLARRLERWSGTAPVPAPQGTAEGGRLHVAESTAQSHLAMGWEAPPEAHPDSMRERLLVRVLGSGSASRLFTEVREKRGLCYSVFASYSSGRDRGMIAVYAGSTPERAATTVEVALEQVASLARGIRPEEHRRATVGLKSRLVMQGESTGARAGSLAGDLFRIGRARSLQEIAAEVDAVSLDGLESYAARRRFEPCTFVSIGPEEVPLPARPAAT